MQSFTNIGTWSLHIGGDLKPAIGSGMFRLLRCVLVFALIWRCVVLQTTVLAMDSGCWKHDPPPRSSSSSSTNFTIVTAMFDIGRGQWDSGYARSYSQYLIFMEQVMKLRVNIIAFADSLAAARIHRIRSLHRLAHKTQIVEMRVEDLPYFHQRERILNIMKNETYRRRNPQAVLGHPEANFPEYDILMLSKIFFVQYAIHADPFNSSYFAWLDGGYGHGQEEIFPEDGEWSPQNLFEHGDKVTMIELGPSGVAEALRKDMHRLHRIRGAAISGGFFGGGKDALRRLHMLEKAVVADWLQRGVIDDDQSCRLLAYYREPRLFRLIQGDWWDVFKLFHKHE